MCVSREGGRWALSCSPKEGPPGEVTLELRHSDPGSCPCGNVAGGGGGVSGAEPLGQSGGRSSCWKESRRGQEY